MRRVLALAAAAAAVGAGPAAAYELPGYACATRVLHSDAGSPVASCRTTGAPRVKSATVAYRVLDVVVTAGAVEATVTCRTPWGYDAVASQVFYPSAERQSLRVEEDYGTCVSSLAAVADDTTAAGVATFAYSFVRR